MFFLDQSNLATVIHALVKSKLDSTFCCTFEECLEASAECCSQTTSHSQLSGECNPDATAITLATELLANPIKGASFDLFKLYVAWDGNMALFSPILFCLGIKITGSGPLDCPINQTSLFGDYRRDGLFSGGPAGNNLPWPPLF